MNKLISVDQVLKWKPMSSAPEDGSFVFVLVKSLVFVPVEIHIAQWDSGLDCWVGHTGMTYTSSTKMPKAWAEYSSLDLDVIENATTNTKIDLIPEVVEMYYWMCPVCNNKNTLHPKDAVIIEREFEVSFECGKCPLRINVDQLKLVG